MKSPAKNCVGRTFHVALRTILKNLTVCFSIKYVLPVKSTGTEIRTSQNCCGEIIVLRIPFFNIVKVEFNRIHY